MAMKGREGLAGGSKGPGCKTASQPVQEALQSRTVSLQRKSWKILEEGTAGRWDETHQRWGGFGSLAKRRQAIHSSGRMEDMKGETHLEAKRKVLLLR